MGFILLTNFSYDVFQKYFLEKPAKDIEVKVLSQEKLILERLFSVLKC